MNLKENFVQLLKHVEFKMSLKCKYSCAMEQNCILTVLFRKYNAEAKVFSQEMVRVF